MGANISVVIPLYNKETYVAETIGSVLRQTYSHFEIVIIDDGSTDNSVEAVRKMNDDRIHIFSQKNQGVSAARNYGVKMAQYDYVAFLDADDEWSVDHLEVIARLIDRFPECGLFGTLYRLELNGNVPTLPIVPNRYPFEGEEGVLGNFYSIASGTDLPFNSSSFAVRRDVFLKSGGYMPGMPAGEDILLYGQLRTLCDFAYSRRPTALIHMSYAQKNERPVVCSPLLDKAFDELLVTGRHKEGVRQFVSSWYKRKILRYFCKGLYRLGFGAFFKAFFIYPFQKKLYTSLAISLACAATGMDAYTLNLRIRKFLGKKN